jgi:predicted transcriptional regulator
MIEQLFGSKTRVKLLRLFYSNPNRPYYVREITRKINEQINSVRRELANLLNIGIISSDNTDNKLYYEVNQEFEYFNPLTEIFGNADTTTSSTKKGTKTVKSAVAPDVDEDIRALGNVHLMLYTGQFTRDESSGIDVLIVGDVNVTQLNKYITSLEEKEGKELRYTLMTP